MSTLSRYSAQLLGTVTNEVERLVGITLGGVSGSRSHLWNRVAVPLESGTAVQREEVTWPS